MTDTDASEVETLFPDVDLDVRDPETGKPVRLTVHEFRFRESLEAQALARPLLDALATAADEGELEASEISSALGNHADAWLELVARATDTEVAWLAGLSDADGEALSDAMWTVNADFFIRRIAGDLAAKRRAEETPLPSPRSSTPSSAPDTGGDTPKSQTG